MTPDPAAPERVVARVRPHAYRLVPAIVVLWIVAFAVPALWSRVDWVLWNPVLAATAAGLVFVFTVVPCVMWAFRRTLITTRRVVIHGGPGARRDVPLHRIHDIEIRRSARQRLVGAGDLVLSTGGGHGVRIVDVPKPALVADAIAEHMDRAGFRPADLAYEVQA